jgi:hypothetical protein
MAFPLFWCFTERRDAMKIRIRNLILIFPIIAMLILTGCAAYLYEDEIIIIHVTDPPPDPWEPPPPQKEKDDQDSKPSQDGKDRPEKRSRDASDSFHKDSGRRSYTRR